MSANGAQGCARFSVPERHNPAVDLAPSGRWTLRDKAAQRRRAVGTISDSVIVRMEMKTPFPPITLSLIGATRANPYLSNNKQLSIQN